MRRGVASASARSSSSPVCCTLVWALRRLAVARPVHRALHEMEATPARVAVRRSALEASSTPIAHDLARGRARSVATGGAALPRHVRSAARRSAASVIPRMGLNMILVNGTDHETLKKGPGRDLRTFMPGENRLVYIAGHRTTYLAPFSHIDSLRTRRPRHARSSRTRRSSTASRATGSWRRRICRSCARRDTRCSSSRPAIRASSPSHRYIVYATLVRVAHAAPRRTRLRGSGERQVAHGSPAASSPSPRGARTSASAPAARAIMCDSWPGDRLEHEPSSSDARARAQELVTPALRRTSVASRPTRTRPGLARALQREQRRPDEQLAADERRDGVARQAEDERASRAPRKPPACPA